MKKENRDFVDIIIANGFSNEKFNSYIYYMNIIAQCKIIVTKDIETAGVNFKGTSYVFYINPDFFESLSLEEQLGVFKHECLHILYGHLTRFPLKDKTLNKHKANIAMDCAINQHIERNHLPDFVIYPDKLQKKLKQNGFNIVIPKEENAETYYDLLPTIEIEEDSGESGDGESGDFYDGLWEDAQISNHEIWNESEGDDLIKKDLTKRMIEKAAEKTRSGHVPNNYSDWLDLWTRKPQVSWKNVLRNVTSNKKANKVPTIMRRSRRFQKRPEIKGYKKDRIFEIIVILDVSGSMNDNEIITGLNEIQEVARLTQSKVKIIQVDTEVKEVEDFNPKTFKRSGTGGTEMMPAFVYIKENKIQMDCCILISDMYIEDISYWDKNGVAPKCKMIFLATHERMPDLSSNSNYSGFKLEQA